MSMFNTAPMAEGYQELTDRAPFFAEALKLEAEYTRAADHRAALATELAGVASLRDEAILDGDAGAYAGAEVRSKELPALIKMAALAEAKARLAFAVANRDAAIAYKHACGELAFAVGKTAGYPEGTAVAIRAESQFEDSRSLREYAGSQMQGAHDALDSALAALAR